MVRQLSRSGDDDIGDVVAVVRAAERVFVTLIRHQECHRCDACSGVMDRDMRPDTRHAGTLCNIVILVSSECRQLITRITGPLLNS